MPAPDPSPTVAVFCPHCECFLWAAGAMAGRTAPCPDCGERLTVPTVDPSGAEAECAAVVARILADLTA